MRCPKCDSLLLSDGVEIPGCPACGHQFGHTVSQESSSGGLIIVGGVILVGFLVWLIFW